MERLTHKRVNGIKQGYWTAAKKDELVERLAAYEDTGLTPEEIMDGKMLTGWIPCSERLPEANQEMLVQWERKDRLLNTIFVYISIGMLGADGEWYSAHESRVFNGKVIAWMPLPEPWEGDKE